MPNRWIYKAPQTFGRIVIAFLTIHVMGDVITTGVNVLATVMHPDTWNDPNAELSDPEALFAIVILLGGIITGLSYITGVILFCCWQYRVATNCRALGAQGMKIAPGWNVGWWFIPFANLVMPFRAMLENYKASDPVPGVTNWQQAATPALFVLWWATWIIGNLLANVAMRLGFQTEPAVVEASVWIGLGSTLVSLCAYACIVVIVRRIGRWQTQRVNNLHMSAPGPWQGEATYMPGG
jgi:hypothetical protein